MPAGTALAVHNGNLRITQPNYVLENTEVRGCITLSANANNVVIRNVKVRANCSWLVENTEGARGLVIQDSELDGNDNTSNDAAVGGNYYTLLRVNIHSSSDGVKAGSGVRIVDSYIHDLTMTSSSHNDGIQSLDAVGLVISHNTIMMQNGATSCVILSQNSGSGWVMRDVDISRNLLAGGAYSVYGGYEAGRDNPAIASNIRVVDNRFSTAVFPRGGAYGPLTSVDGPVVVHTGNAWADGPNAGRSAD